MGVVLETGHDWGAMDFAGGALCLNFTNTMGGHGKSRDFERIPTYADLLRWAQAAGVLDAAEAAALQKQQRAAPAEAEQRLKEAQAFREALYGVLAALVVRGKAGAEPAAADLARVRTTIARALGAAHLGLQDGTFAWTLAPPAPGLDLVLARVALATQRFLSQEQPAHVRQCERCNWFFLDTSKNQRRRWCTPDVCGNRSRADRHYRKAKAAAG